MGTELWDSHGNRVTLADRIGRGGEGEVFDVTGRPEQVAKIYHASKATQQITAKLRAMISLRDSAALDYAAWPISVLRDRANGNARGFTMPKVRGREIHDLYDAITRRKFFPAADWRFLVTVARNLAAAFETLHGLRVVVGDVNSRNVWVNTNATITLVDCDSFSLEIGETRYPGCGVGVPDFTPPELQGARWMIILRGWSSCHRRRGSRHAKKLVRASCHRPEFPVMASGSTTTRLNLIPWEVLQACRQLTRRGVVIPNRKSISAEFRRRV